jgi:hypothetical protein
MIMPPIGMVGEVSSLKYNEGIPSYSSIERRRHEHD